jgi:hypothetical protein
VSAYNGGIPQAPAEIEAMIEERRDRLATTVDELVSRTRPKALLHRTLADLQLKVNTVIRTESGDLRTGRLALAGGSAVAVVALMVTVRRGKARRRARG